MRLRPRYAGESIEQDCDVAHWCEVCLIANGNSASGLYLSPSRAQSRATVKNRTVIVVDSKVVVAAFMAKRRSTAIPPPSRNSEIGMRGFIRHGIAGRHLDDAVCHACLLLTC